LRVELNSTVSVVLIMASVFWPVRIFAQDRPLDLVESIDLQRYQGLWYEIGRLPNRFQDECSSNVTAEYTLLDDGRIKVVNRCKRPNGEMNEAEGVARRPDPDREAALEVRFAPKWLSWLSFVWGDYQIMALSDDYRSVLIGAPSREYLWILAREPVLPEDRLDELLDEADRQGFNTANVRRTTQDW